MKPSVHVPCIFGKDFVVYFIYQRMELFKEKKYMRIQSFLYALAFINYLSIFIIRILIYQLKIYNFANRENLSCGVEKINKLVFYYSRFLVVFIFYTNKVYSFHSFLVLLVLVVCS